MVIDPYLIGATLIQSLYENSVLGKIPERQYQRLMAQYDEEQTVCEARIAELKKELDNVETTKVDLKRFIKLIQKYKDCETLTDEMLYELVEKVVIHSASGGRTIHRQQQIDIYFNFIGDTFPSQIEIHRSQSLSEAGGRIFGRLVRPDVLLCSFRDGSLYYDAENVAGH